MQKLKVLLPKGRIYEGVRELLFEAGIEIYLPERTYFPLTNSTDLTFQVVKPQIASLLLLQGKADLCFSGADWVCENEAEDKIEEVLDLGLDKVKIIAAIPDSMDESVIKDGVTIATEYEKLSKNWLKKRGLTGQIFRTYGTSEGFVRQDKAALAQVLIDNSATGSSLRANNLKVIDTLMESSTRLYANKESMKDKEVRDKVSSLKMLFTSILEARKKVMLEMNVLERDFEPLVEALPSMKSPTVSPLFNSNAYAIKTVVNKEEVPALLIKLKSLGATDIVEYALRKVIQ